MILLRRYVGRCAFFARFLRPVVEALALAMLDIQAIPVLAAPSEPGLSVTITHGVPASWLTTIPRAASRSSTILRLSGKRIESHTACSMTLAGDRSSRSMDFGVVIIALEEPMFVDASST
jgi:hypothetical protein